MSDRLAAVRMDAFALAMQAKCGAVSPHDLDMMVARAEETLPHDDTLYRAITRFATQHAVSRFDPDVMMELGAELHDAVRLHCLPTPVDIGRADIYG